MCVCVCVCVQVKVYCTPRRAKKVVFGNVLISLAVAVISIIPINNVYNAMLDHVLVVLLLMVIPATVIWSLTQ